MTRRSAGSGSKLARAVVGAVLLASCSGAQVATNPEDPAAWRNRGIWVENKDNVAFVMVVGSTSHASMDRSMSMDTAEQDARERLTIYLGSTVQAFRERLARRIDKVAQKSGSSAAAGGAEQTDRSDRAGRTIAENSVRGLEIVNSFVEKDTDNLFVLGRLNFDAFRQVLAQSSALSSAEKAEIERNSEEVRQEFDRALQDARSAGH